MDIIILLVATIVGYKVLHSVGGRRLADASTSEGKRERLILWGLVVVLFAGMMLVFVRRNASPSMMITPLAVGVMAVLLSNLKSRK